MGRFKLNDERLNKKMKKKAAKRVKISLPAPPSPVATEQVLPAVEGSVK